MRQQFRADLEATLGDLPFNTTDGFVAEDLSEERFGFRGGNHQPIECWVYRRTGTDLEMRFGFYQNFSPDDLICKVVQSNQEIASGAGASVQFNGDLSVSEERGIPVLCHNGKVTVGQSIKRTELLRLIGITSPEGLEMLGGLSWPFRIGKTDEMEDLLDNLFVYVYCVEQAKRSIRKNPLLPHLSQK